MCENSKTFMNENLFGEYGAVIIITEPELAALRVRKYRNQKRKSEMGHKFPGDPKKKLFETLMVSAGVRKM